MDKQPPSPGTFAELAERLRGVRSEVDVALSAMEVDQERFWNSLSLEDQLKAFCAVSRRIYNGEIKHNGTFRYVLYDVFGFGPEAYMPAQVAGYLAIHNSIFRPEDERAVLRQFCEHHCIEDADTKINQFYDNNI